MDASREARPQGGASDESAAEGSVRRGNGDHEKGAVATPIPRSRGSKPSLSTTQPPNGLVSMTREQEKHRRDYRRVYDLFRRGDPETRRRLMRLYFHSHVVKPPKKVTA